MGQCLLPGEAACRQAPLERNVSDSADVPGGHERGLELKARADGFRLTFRLELGPRTLTGPGPGYAQTRADRHWPCWRLDYAGDANSAD